SQRSPSRTRTEDSERVEQVVEAVVAGFLLPVGPVAPLVVRDDSVQEHVGGVLEADVLDGLAEPVWAFPQASDRRLRSLDGALRVEKGLQRRCPKRADS